VHPYAPLSSFLTGPSNPKSKTFSTYIKCRGQDRANRNKRNASNHSILMAFLKDLQSPVLSLRRLLQSLLVIYNPKHVWNPRCTLSLYPNHVRKLLCSSLFQAWNRSKNQKNLRTQWAWGFGGWHLWKTTSVKYKSVAFTPVNILSTAPSSYKSSFTLRTTSLYLESIHLLIATARYLSRACNHWILFNNNSSCTARNGRRAEPMLISRVMRCHLEEGSPL
jgi:hypothetical protein